MAYKPEPVDTSKIELTSPLDELTERLAQNVHEAWAQQRIADGWRLGPERNDRKKEHPCLVPYEQLPESEREYDRRTVAETLKVVIALGYTIQRA